MYHQVPSSSALKLRGKSVWGHVEVQEDLEQITQMLDGLAASSRFPTTRPVPGEQQILQPASSNPLCSPSPSSFCTRRHRSPHVATTRRKPPLPLCKVQQLRQNHQETGSNSTAGLCAEVRISSFIHQTASGVKVSGRRGQQRVGTSAPLSSIRAARSSCAPSADEPVALKTLSLHKGATVCCTPAANASPRAEDFHQPPAPGSLYI